MIENLPTWVNLLFISAIFYTILIFHLCNGKPRVLTSLLFAWTVLQSVLGYVYFYHDTSVSPPRFALVLLPALALFIFSLLPKQREWILARRDTKISTFLHVVRLPIEIVLFQLFIYQMIPELMTFEGRNFDIIAGISAPIIGLLFYKDIISKRVLLVWNFIGLALVLFIFFNGILSAELPFQQFGFEQPNRAVIHFPFIILPATIVPIVIWTHVTDIIKLSRDLKIKAAA